MPRLLELGGEHLTRLDGRDGEGDQRGGHVQIVEGARHGVLAADGGAAQLQLGVQGPQQGGEGLAPAGGLVPQLLKELLEGQIGLPVVRAGGHQLGYGGVDRVLCPLVGVGGQGLGVAAPGHDAGLAGLLLRLHGEEGGHDLGRGALGLAAEGHEHAARADGAVKPLGEAAAGGALQAGGHLPQGGEGRPLRGGVRLGHGHPGVLGRAVGVEEGPGQAGHGLAPPGHDHAGLRRDRGHRVGLQVLPGGGGQQGVHVRRGHHHGHALLGLGDGQLGAVQAVVLLAHRVQVDGQAVSQLADSHAHAAGAEVVAPLDEAGDGGVAEETLELALLRGVALLHLAGHGVQAGLVVALGGAGGAADAVPAGAAAQEDHHVAGGGPLPADVGRRGRAHHRAALQVLSHIALVVELRHVAGGQADLVAVGGVARRGGLGDLPLGQLALQGLLHRGAGVAAASEAHGLVDVYPAGEGVADAPADAGGRAAKGLDLGGVVVGLVLEHEQPVLLLPVHLGGHVDGAGVNLLALVQLGEQAPLFQGLGAQGGDVHEGLGPLGGLLRAVDLHPGGQVPLIGGLYVVIGDLHLVQVGGEGGVAAVIRPVGVHHPHLGEGGIAALLVPEVGLEEGEIGQIHGQGVLGQHPLQTRAVQGGEALQHGHGSGDGVVLAEGGGLVQRRLPALHRVDEVAAGLGRLLGGEGPLQHVDGGGADGGALPAVHHLDTLGAGVGPLVVLAGQGLHRKQGVLPLRGGHDLIPQVVHLRLREHGGAGGGIDRRVHPLHVVAAQHPHAGQPRQAQGVAQLSKQMLRLHGKAGLLLHITAKYVPHTLFLSLM